MTGCKYEIPNGTLYYAATYKTIKLKPRTHLSHHIPSKQNALHYPSRRQRLFIPKMLPNQLQPNRRPLIPLRPILPPLPFIYLIPRPIPCIHPINTTIHHNPTRKHNRRLVENVPDRSVVPVMGLAEHSCGTRVDRCEEEIDAAGFHEGVVFVAQGVAGGVEGPVLIDGEGGWRGVVEGPLG